MCDTAATHVSLYDRAVQVDYGDRAGPESQENHNILCRPTTRITDNI